MSAPPTGHVRLATASPATHSDGTAATLSQLEAIARRAAANKADLLLLPEAYLGGYPRGADFGAIIGGRSAKGRAEYAAYFRQAIDLGDALYAQNVNLYLAPTADARDAWLSLMRSVGCEGRCFVVSSNMAVREKPSSGASGNGVQRQQQQQQGNGVRGRQGSCITEEGHEIVLPGDKSASTSPTGARKARRKSVMVEDGHEVVLGCDDDNSKSMPEGLKPSVDWTNGTKRADDAASGWSCRGGSSIVGPFGDVLAGPQWEDDETIIYADVNFEDCVGGRLDLDAGSSYSRNDSFKFSVEGLDLEPLPYY
ncbi:hypothetical protein BN1708_016151 [Verticillium longisporum]|uniref:CN hydrolase domain-containing protein n=1 Tax=Verticillium longisporum TaxID=100787 RepID=A0A0G4MEU3_VERLO|nr:hypothetical protein BN1708_016151 [Verticillium longisporum]